MKAIYKKELKSYFTSVIGCLFIAITLLIEGGFFVLYNLCYFQRNAYTCIYYTYPYNEDTG